MWNAKTKQLVADEKLVVIGVVQEQHAERARLYKQWREFDFPIVQDAITELGLAVVPVPVLIDEHGVVMSTRPQPNRIAQTIAQPAKQPAEEAPKLAADYRNQVIADRESLTTGGGAGVCALGDAYLNAALAGQDSVANVTRAIEAYQNCLSNNEKSKLTGHLNFRLGVAYRLKFDIAAEGEQDANDFTVAAKHWSQALAVNPNQYIWRRRIQQYGPRLDKPYPFYDWVAQAQREIKDRGAVPVELEVALAGAELARPDRKFKSSAESESNPDPDSKVTQDTEMVSIHSTAVPQVIAPGQAVRVHVRFDLADVKWNNESEDMVVWIEPSEFGSLTRSHLSFPSPQVAESSEIRNVEFEFKTAKSTTSSFELKGSAFYYVCRDDNGQCVYRRQDFTVPITIDPTAR